MFTYIIQTQFIFLNSRRIELTYPIVYGCTTKPQNANFWKPTILVDDLRVNTVNHRAPRSQNILTHNPIFLSLTIFLSYCEVCDLNCLVTVDFQKMSSHVVSDQKLIGQMNKKTRWSYLKSWPLNLYSIFRLIELKYNTLSAIIMFSYCV